MNMPSSSKIPFILQFYFQMAQDIVPGKEGCQD